MSRRWSLRGRLTRRVLAALAGAWLLSLAIGVYTIGHEMNELLDKELQTQARLILSLEQAGAEIPDLSPDLRIRIADGHSADGPVAEAPWPALGEDGLHAFPDWRVLRLTDPAQGISIEIGQSSALRRDGLFESARAFVFLMFFVLIIGGVTIWFGTRSALRPARQFAESMGRREATDLTPMEDTGLPEELVPIPLSLNSYLARIEALILSERRFAADAAHELRTPVAIALAQAQLLTPHMMGIEEIETLQAALGRLSHLIARLLQLSRAEADLTSHRDTVDLIGICNLLIADRASCGITFDDGDREDAEVAIDLDSLAILLSNLIENACEHGEGEVRVRLLSDRGLEISNRVQAEARFRHARFDRSAESGGSGLGLSIVATIAALNDVDLEYEVADGRARVRLTFQTDRLA